MGGAGGVRQEVVEGPLVAVVGVIEDAEDVGVVQRRGVAGFQR